MAWEAVRISEIAAGPFAAAPLRSRESTQSLALPSVAALRYLERVKGQESRLLTALEIDPADLDKETTASGVSISNYVWTRSPAWMSRDLMDIARIVIDDLWQIRQSRINVFERVMRWKRVFGAEEKMDARLNVAGLPENVAWLQQTYTLRHSYAGDLVRKSRHGWNLVQGFYDSASRASQNILEGGLALQHYLKVKGPSP
jgi:hypothetical protein